jgi:hypothetical protein
MGKKIILLIFAGLVVWGLIKIFFFSGITQTAAAPPSFRKADQPGYVWASAGEQYHRSRLGAFFLGQHYRPVWTTPIKVPVLDIAQVNGGLRIGKMGGGQQTTSLSLIGPNGEAWVLRSLDKDPVNILYPFWRRTIFANLMRDQIASSHPYAAPVVSSLAGAAGIFHTNPRIVFISATDSRFGQYRNRMGNRLFLLEEKYTGNPQLWPQFKSASVLLNSHQMLRNRFRRQSQRIDQLAFAQCRLFDLLIGDWDRHEGQWTWAAYPTDSLVYYKPIPKDRDQAFSRYQDGLVPWLLTRDFALRKFGQFDDQMPDVADFTVNAAFLDERALNVVTLPEFITLARQLQAKLTDSVIIAAVKELPPPIYQLSGPELIQGLKSRRQNLVQIATDYYRLLARHVLVPGTDQREKFEITRLDNGRTQIKVYQLMPAGGTGSLLYQRIFKKPETAEITLHGLGGDDEFVVTGKVKSSIKINIVGGLGEDKIADFSEVAAGGKYTFVFDTQKGNEITWGPDTEDKTTNNLAVHYFDRQGL